MKNILFIGDSLTEGIVGVNFVDLITCDDSKIEIGNMGLGGDTLSGVSNRLYKAFEDKHYDLVIFSAGHNDIVLPHMKQRGPQKKKFVDNILNSGIELTQTMDAFRHKLEEVIQFIEANHSKIVILTLSVLGENLDSELNRKRRDINQLIREFTDVCVLDIGKIFDDQLMNANSSDYLMDSILKLVGEDPIRCRKGESMMISSERNLKLTIDGAHLNMNGAKIYADSIQALLDEMIEDGIQ